MTAVLAQFDRVMQLSKVLPFRVIYNVRVYEISCEWLSESVAYAY